MTEFTPERISELRQIAGRATHGKRTANGSLTQIHDLSVGQTWGPNWRADQNFMVEVTPDAVLALIAALEAKAAEVEALQAWQAQTVRRVRDTVASEHFTMLVVEDIPNADFGELIDTLVEQRDDARAALKAKDSYVGDLEEQLKHIKSLWRATGRAEADAHRRADRAEAAIERVREAATEVTNQGDNHGRTHYESCWKQHLHCLAAKIIYETGADDE